MTLALQNQIETITWADGQGEITLRPLTVQEVTEALEPLTTELAAFFDQVITSAPTRLLEDQELNKLLVAIVWKHWGTVLNRAIAFSAEVPDRIDEIARLPFDVSISCGYKICEITFGDVQTFLKVAQTIGNEASARSAAVSGQRH